MKKTKIAILGAGAMGSLVGAFLIRGGADVILVDPYEAHMDTIRTTGLTMHINEETICQQIPTCYHADQAGPVDVVICLVKSLFTEKAFLEAKALFKPSTLILTLQNGLGNADTISHLFSPDRILQGVMKITSQLNAPGELTSHILPEMTAIHIGTMNGNTDAIVAAQSLAVYWCKGGLKAEYHDNINDFIWGKAVNNIAINSACAITRLNIGSFLSEPKGWFITEQCIREVIAVANAKGIKLNFNTVTESIQKNTIPKFGSHYPSTAQDVMNKKTTEIETLNGAIVKYGKRLGIPTPYNECVAAFIQVIQNHYSDMF
ncbi:2-dehydropantoate 2-reductase [Pseudocoprococcus immobilis]